MCESTNTDFKSRTGDNLQFGITEEDHSGRISVAFLTNSASGEPRGDFLDVIHVHRGRTSWRPFLSNVFLPSGYPTSVSPDYLKYQIYNAVQAFCSSLSGLIASRAVLEGHGVGDASASATHAISLTVIQDVFGRVTTVVAGYYLGTSLFPEAKTYRLLADIFNDVAILLDALSPHLSAVQLSCAYPYVSFGSSGSYLRVASLCLSGAFRALCGVVAGGSKAALTVHFATSGKGIGDVGDLNAKDGSKETVLALLGMLGGTVVLHYVHSAHSVYVIFFVLLFCHLAANYVAVRVVVMRSFNRQRANIAWMAYRTGFTNNKTVLTPEAVARREHIFGNPAALYDASSPERRLGSCKIGSSFAFILSRSPYRAAAGVRTPQSRRSDGELSISQVHAILEVFSAERYVLWFDPAQRTSLHLHVCLKDGHTAVDHLKGWAHVQELALLLRGKVPRTFDERIAAVRTSLATLGGMFPLFVRAAQASGWRTDESALVAGSARTISVKSGQDIAAHEAPVEIEDRKDV